MLTGQYVDPRAGTLTFAQWFTSYAAQQVWVDGTHEAAATAANSVPFGDVPMSRIAPSHVQAWVKGMTTGTAARPHGLAASTIRTRFNYVSMVFRAAVVDRVIATDPTKGVKLPRARKAEHAMSLPAPAQVAVALALAEGWFIPFVAVSRSRVSAWGKRPGCSCKTSTSYGRTIAVRRQVQGASRPPHLGATEVRLRTCRPRPAPADDNARRAR